MFVYVDLAKQGTRSQKGGRRTLLLLKMAGKGKGKRLTDSERMEIISRLEDKTTPLSRAKCARLYGVTPAAISKLMKVSQTVKKRYSDAGVEAGHLRDKRQRGGFSKNMCFEDELYKWICSIRARKIPLLVAHVQQKAKLLAGKHHMNDDFKASNGWYYRFCARYGLAPGSLHAGGGGGIGRPNLDGHAHRMNTAGVSDGEDTKESTSGDEKNAAIWSDDPETSEKVANLQNAVKKYGPESVYSLSEARLFYKLLPNQLCPVGQQDDSENAVEDDAASSSKGNTERVLVLVCANGTGTHKIPLLVVGKHSRPSCFAFNPMQHGQNSMQEHTPPMQIGATKYFSQREVWCDNQTFQYWCHNVFVPAIQQRTTQPVLLLMDNPGGNLEKFEHTNVETYFLPTRAGSLSTMLQLGASSSQAQFQPMQHGVIRELKRRYKISVFQETLNFLEKGDEERYRLLQRALKRPQGAAGIAFGRLPHVLDAMGLLGEVWDRIPAALLRDGWVRSCLYAEGFPEVKSESHRPEISDDTVVLELCAMLRNVKSVDELHGLPKEIRLWMYADDDSSERMQQELLHDVQRLLQEEEEESKTGANSTAMGGAYELHLQNLQHGQLHPGVPPMYVEHNNNMVGYGYHHPHHPHAFGQHPSTRPPQPQQHVDSPASLREKRKAINFVFRALSNAEEALDNVDVSEYFGDDATSDAMETLGALLRRLRRIHRGKQSTLPAPAASAMLANANPSDAVANGHALPGHEHPSANEIGANVHAYFYGGAK